jgi:hypothetical protein
MARRLVKRHPFARRRNERQRFASFGATSTRTFSTSRHDSAVNLILNQKIKSTWLDHHAAAVALTNNDPD